MTQTVIDSFTGKYRFLSNFYYHPVVFEDIEYPTNEHAFQAAKTISMYKREQIVEAESPREAKRLGRLLTIRDHWDSYWRYNVMMHLVAAKFVDPILSSKLLKTNNAILIEGNTWGDTTWGMVGGKGHNILGWMLMEMRTQIENVHGSINESNI